MCGHFSLNGFFFAKYVFFMHEISQLQTQCQREFKDICSLYIKTLFNYLKIAQNRPTGNTYISKKVFTLA